MTPEAIRNAHQAHLAALASLQAAADAAGPDHQALGLDDLDALLEDDQ